MFRLSHEPINDQSLKGELLRARGGALVVFEGVVRSRNNNRDVIALEYEGAEGVAAKEFEKIAGEVREQFDFMDVACVHRVGRLSPGETAVWIGVSSVHRSAAFAACKYVIDELKKRLPIWKKEYYADGASGWINAP